MKINLKLPQTATAAGLLVLGIIVLSLALAFGLICLLAFAVMVFATAPSFWGAFWLVALAMVIFTAISKAL